MVRFVVELDASRVAELRQQLEGVVDNPRPLLEGIAGSLEGMATRAFEAQGLPGRPWQPLHPRTRYRRRKSGRGARILDDTGRLKQSINSRVTGNRLEVGSNLPYAAIHQFGGTIAQQPRSDRSPRTLARVGGRLLFRGRDGKVRVGSKLDGTPVRKAFPAAASTRLSFGPRKIVIPARPYLPRAGQLTDRERRFLSNSVVHYIRQKTQMEGS